MDTLLRRCKVLASHIGSPQLEQWSTWEALGYPTEETVPEYRIWPLRLTGQFVGRFGKTIKNAPIPLHYLPDEVRGYYEAYECRQSIATVEEHLRQADDGLVGVGTGDVHLDIGRKMYPSYECVKVSADFSAASLTEMLNAVRHRIIDFSIALLKQQTQASPPTNGWGSKYSSNGAPSNSTQMIVSPTVGRYSVPVEDPEQLEAWAKRRRMDRDS